MSESPFGMRKDLRASYEEALTRVPEALATQGFGVLTEIDLQATLQRKLGIYEATSATQP